MVPQMAIARKNLYSSFEDVSEELIQVLTAFDQEQINKVPYAGSWTAAQVGEHLFKSDSAILKALYGPVKATDRAIDEKAEGIEAAFLDFSTQMKAPDLIIPADIEHEKEILISALKSTRDLLGKAIKTLDLSLTCTDPAMSGIVGEWTRQEYIHFVIAHTQRHIHQLKKIYNKLLTA